MTAGFGGLLAAFGAFCYALSSVSIAKSSQSVQGRGNDVLISVLMTAVVSGALWLLLGPTMPELGRALVHEEGVTLINAWISEMESER